MKKLILFSSLLFAFATNAQIASTDTSLIKFIQLTPSVYQHISYLKTQTWGKVGCNGAVYIEGNEAIIFDTPTNDKSSEVLYRSLAKSGIKVVGVVINHFHADCLGGLKFFHEKGVKSYSSKLTQKLATADSVEVPQIGFENELKLKLGKKTITNVHLGAAHTRDNIVSYMDTEKVLFGGCMVKALEAGRGYLGDADVTQWSNTIEKVKKRFPKAKIVIPGHEDAGGQELLDYTAKMFMTDKK
ncbi:MAG: subclass B1 metallo-beta-lactamase [Spirosomaceae bacterium]|jgi:metallo-beta-lactamase class B|nr:subclass B1 metallo-beta-lactamase [Spirosomataceae bacterium]